MLTVCRESSLVHVGRIASAVVRAKYKATETALDLVRRLSKTHCGRNGSHYLLSRTEGQFQLDSEWHPHAHNSRE